MSFLDDYEPVEDRLAKFWADHPEGRVITELLPASQGEFIVQAFIHRDSGEVTATGLAHEVVGQGSVNQTSALENCETSAIGRALANMGYAAKNKRPSREEMEKAIREDHIPDGAEWLANAVDMFKEWDAKRRKTIAGEIAREIGAQKPMTLEEAKKVHAKMSDLYYKEHPGDETRPF